MESEPAAVDGRDLSHDLRKAAAEHDVETVKKLLSRGAGTL